MSLREYQLMSRGFYESKLEREKQEWERTRWAVWYGLQPHIKKGTLRKPTDLGRFPWERGSTVDIKELKKQGLELVRRWGRTLDSVN